jgi:hypothetical protein
VLRLEEQDSLLAGASRYKGVRKKEMLNTEFTEGEHREQGEERLLISGSQL